MNKNRNIMPVGVFAIVLFFGFCAIGRDFDVNWPVSIQSLFSGQQRVIARVSHSGKDAVTKNIYVNLYQNSSTTSIPLGRFFWKQLTVQPGQTVSEIAKLEFPSVKAKTEFMIDWQDEKSNSLGDTTVFIYPTNLLAELKSLAGGEPIGLLDWCQRFKPSLEATGIKVSDLENEGMEHYEGKLIIAKPPYKKPAQEMKQLRAWVEKGVAVVLFRPHEYDESENLKPSFYTVPVGNGRIVVADASLVERFSDNPQSQLNLISLCRQALQTEVPCLPFIDSNP